MFKVSDVPVDEPRKEKKVRTQVCLAPSPEAKQRAQNVLRDTDPQVISDSIKISSNGGVWKGEFCLKSLSFSEKAPGADHESWAIPKLSRAHGSGGVKHEGIPDSVFQRMRFSVWST